MRSPRVRRRGCAAQLVEDPAAAGGVVGDRVGQPEAADQVEGGLHQLAHAGPRLVDAEQLDGEPVRLAADPLLERRRPPRSRAASVRAATQSSSAAVNTGEVKWSASISSTARVRRRPVGSSAAAAGELLAADLGEVLDGGEDQVVLGREVVQLGPRLTPARWETSVVDVPLQPCSTRHSTVASSSRCRMARVRSSWGTRTVVVTRPS